MRIHSDTLQFFNELLVNNNRDWFNANKPRWTAIQSDFLDFTQALIDAMTPIAPGLRNLQAKQCVYRIYRDLRFTTDKRPYKTHIACFLYSGGDRTVCSPGYYMQVGVGDYGLQSGCTLGGGFFMPTPKQLAAIRQEIFYCTDEFKAIMNEPNYKKYFGNQFFTRKKLSRPPKGFPADWPDVDLLKWTDYTTMYDMPEKYILTDKLFDQVLKVWKASLPLNLFLERAIEDIHE